METFLSILNEVGECVGVGEIKNPSDVTSIYVDFVPNDDLEQKTWLPSNGELELEYTFHRCSSFLFNRAGKDKYFYRCEDEDCENEMILNLGVNNGR